VSGNGRITGVRRVDDLWQVEFMAEPRSSPQSLWFHVQAEGAAERKVRFRWLNADACLGLGSPEALSNVRPVLQQDGAEWRRASNTRLCDREAGGQFLEFGPARACRQVAAAFCYPYGPDELRKTLDAVGDAWEARPIGMTGGGRVLTRLRAGVRSGGERGPGAYVVARQHAGETPGSWVLDGLLREVAASPQGTAARAVEWWVVPFIDLDGVVRGDYGKDALPWDFNRSWRPMPMRPEVLCVQQDLRRFAEANEPRVVLDLHAPGGGESGLYHFLPREGRPEEQREASETFTACLGEQFPGFGPGSLSRVPDYPSRWSTSETLTNWVWEHLDRTLGVSVETSYQRIGEREWLDVPGYRGTGRKLSRALTGWLTSRG
jgi:hypothetical protein